MFDGRCKPRHWPLLSQVFNPMYLSPLSLLLTGALSGGGCNPRRMNACWVECSSFVGSLSWIATLMACWTLCVWHGMESVTSWARWGKKIQCEVPTDISSDILCHTTNSVMHWLLITEKQPFLKLFYTDICEVLSYACATCTVPYPELVR